MAAVDEAVQSEAKESPEEIAQKAAAAARRRRLKQERLLRKRAPGCGRHRRIPVLKMAERTMDRQRRELEAALRRSTPKYKQKRKPQCTCLNCRGGLIILSMTTSVSLRRTKPCYGARNRKSSSCSLNWKKC